MWGHMANLGGICSIWSQGLIALDPEPFHNVFHCLTLVKDNLRYLPAYCIMYKKIPT